MNRADLLEWMRGARVAGVPANVRPKQKSKAAAKPHGGFDFEKMRALAGDIDGYRAVPRNRFVLLVPKAPGMLPDARVDFGKHSGSRISELAESDPSYLQFLVNAAESPEEDGFVTEELGEVARAWLENIPAAARGKKTTKRRGRR